MLKKICISQELSLDTIYEILSLFTASLKAGASREGLQTISQLMDRFIGKETVQLIFSKYLCTVFGQLGVTPILFSKALKLEKIGSLSLRPPWLTPSLEDTAQYPTGMAVSGLYRTEPKLSQNYYYFIRISFFQWIFRSAHQFWNWGVFQNHLLFG